MLRIIRLLHRQHQQLADKTLVRQMDHSFDVRTAPHRCWPTSLRIVYGKIPWSSTASSSIPMTICQVHFYDCCRDDQRSKGWTLWERRQLRKSSGDPAVANRWGTSVEKVYLEYIRRYRSSGKALMSWPAQVWATYKARAACVRQVAVFPPRKLGKVPITCSGQADKTGIAHWKI